MHYSVNFEAVCSASSACVCRTGRFSMAAALNLPRSLTHLSLERINSKYHKDGLIISSALLPSFPAKLTKLKAILNWDFDIQPRPLPRDLTTLDMWWPGGSRRNRAQTPNVVRVRSAYFDVPTACACWSAYRTGFFISTRWLACFGHLRTSIKLSQTRRKDRRIASS